MSILFKPNLGFTDFTRLGLRIFTDMKEGAHTGLIKVEGNMTMDSEGFVRIPSAIHCSLLEKYLQPLVEGEIIFEERNLLCPEVRGKRKQKALPVAIQSSLDRSSGQRLTKRKPLQKSKRKR